MTGRLKDCIIIRGQNHYPQDIERTVMGSHAAIAPHASAAFSIADKGIERLVVVSELRRQPSPDFAEVITAVRSAVSACHELQAYAVVLLKPARLPRTSSGKVRRRACREQFLARTLETVAIDLLQSEEGETVEPAWSHASPSSILQPGRSGLETQLRQEIAQILLLPAARVDSAAPLVGLGLDSLAAAELAQRLEFRFGLKLPPIELLGEVTLAGLVEQINEMAKTAPPSDSSHSRPEVEECGPVPLSEVQKAMLLTWQAHPECAALHVSGAARLRETIDPDAMFRACAHLMDRHPLLKSVIRRELGTSRSSGC